MKKLLVATGIVTLIATTVIEQRIDDVFNDEVMTMLFPNMVFKDE